MCIMTGEWLSPGETKHQKQQAGKRFREHCLDLVSVPNLLLSGLGSGKTLVTWTSLLPWGLSEPWFWKSSGCASYSFFCFETFVFCFQLQVQVAVQWWVFTALLWSLPVIVALTFEGVCVTAWGNQSQPSRSRFSRASRRLKAQIKASCCNPELLEGKG